MMCSKVLDELLQKHSPVIHQVIRDNQVPYIFALQWFHTIFAYNFCFETVCVCMRACVYMHMPCPLLYF